MKRIASIFLCLVMLLGLCACSSEGHQPQFATTLPPMEEQTGPSQTTQAPPETTEATVEAGSLWFYLPVAEEEFPALLQGGLTKEQFEAFLWIAPSDYSGMALTGSTLSRLINGMATASEKLGIGSGINENWQGVYSLEDMNRVLSVLTKYRISEENHPDQVDGDHYVFSPAGGRGSAVTITSAEHNGAEMRVKFFYHDSGLGPDSDEMEERMAILRRNENGRYRITAIGAAEDMALMDLMIPDGSPAWKYACWKLVFDAPRESYTVSDGTGTLRVSDNRLIVYRLWDLNGNGTPELILQVSSTEDGPNILSFRNSWVGIYTFDEGEPAWLYTGVYYMPRMVWDDSTQSLIVYSVDAFNGRATYFALGMENGNITEELIFEGQFDSLDGDVAYNDEHGYGPIPSAEADDFSFIINN